jgi:hypothetical protein
MTAEYILKNPKNMAEEKAIGMEILSTSGNTYTFKFGLVGSAQKQKIRNKIIRLIRTYSLNLE